MQKTKLVRKIYSRIVAESNKIRTKMISQEDAKFVKGNSQLEKIVNHYNKNSISTGVSVSDMVFLYKSVVEKKYLRILELGSGASTAYLAQALYDLTGGNAENTHFVSCEDIPEYHQNAMDCLPDHLRPFVKYHLSPKVQKNLNFLRGVGYQVIPDGPYDMVFVDGPTEIIDGQKTFCFDAIEVLRRQSHPLDIIIDNKTTTVLSMSVALGRGRVKFDTCRRLGIIPSVSREDLILEGSIKSGKVNSAYFEGIGSVTL